MFLSFIMISMPAVMSELTILVNATVLVDLMPKHVIIEFTLADTPSHANIPSMGNR
jgi:hypothetical protein